MSAVQAAEPAAPAKKRPRKPAAMSDRSRHEQRLGWYLCAPAVIVMLAVTAWPMVQAVWLSLQSYRITDPESRKFIGIKNYTMILTDALWWTDVGVTVLITVITVIVELVLGFAIATVMHRIIFGRGPVRVTTLIPYGIITVVAAFSWKFAFAPDSGFVDSWLGLKDFDFFGQFGTSILVICLSEIWKTTPFMALLLLAGLAQVPNELHEAARVDGATAWQRLWRVTVPNMKAAIMVALLFRTLDAFRIFDNVFVMTAGANNTEVVSFLAYREVIGRTAIGLGSAVSVLLFLMVVLIAYLFIKLFKTDLSQVRGE